MKTIPVYRNRVKVAESLVDDDMHHYLSKFKWYLDNYGYVRRHIWTKEHNTKSRYIHHEVIGTKVGDENIQWVADHINRNKLDNRKSNLRMCSSSQNGFNRTKSYNKSSKMMGVSWHKQQQKWESTITKSGKKLFLGMFKTQRMAYNAYKFAKPIITNDIYDDRVLKTRKTLG